MRYKDAVKKRAVIRESAKTYNRYLQNDNRVANKLNWCKEIGNRVNTMIKDKVMAWTHAQLDSLKGKIQGYMKAPRKSRPSKSTGKKKAARKPKKLKES